MEHKDFSNLGSLFEADAEIKAQLHRLVDDASVAERFAMLVQQDGVTARVAEVRPDLEKDGELHEFLDVALKMIVHKVGKLFDVITAAEPEGAEQFIESIVELSRITPYLLASMIQNGMDKVGTREAGD